MLIRLMALALQRDRYHTGVGAALSRLEEVQAATLHYSAVVHNYASSPALTEPKVRVRRFAVWYVNMQVDDSVCNANHLPVP